MKKVLLSALLILLLTQVWAQTQGLIIKPALSPGNAVLDPGFEAEIVPETNFNVNAYNIDGLNAAGTPVASFLYDSHCQKSMAVSTASGGSDYFYDFYLPFSYLSSLFSSSTPIRIVAVTTMNPHPAIGNNALSDVEGVMAGGNIDDQFIDLIDGQTPTPPGEEIADRTPCPSIIGSIGTSSPSISGTLSGGRSIHKFTLVIHTI
jgi:hypothetical protein